MIFQYGSYIHEANENWLHIEARFRHNNLGLPTIIHNRWTIYGTLRQADGDVTALTVKMNTLEDAYDDDGFDFKVFDNDGTTLTQHVLLNNAAVNGVQVKHFEWLERDPRHGQSGTEYVNKRTYRIILEAETINDGASDLVSWEETVIGIGTGGPEFVIKPALVSPPQKQDIQQVTPFYAIQRGRAVGFLGYPAVIATPIWPTDEHVTRKKIWQGTPKFGTKFNTLYPINWEYQFESASSLTGGPTLFNP